jgi:hypothetical protein
MVRALAVEGCAQRRRSAHDGRCTPVGGHRPFAVPDILVAVTRLSPASGIYSIAPGSLDICNRRANVANANRKRSPESVVPESVAGLLSLDERYVAPCQPLERPSRSSIAGKSVQRVLTDEDSEPRVPDRDLRHGINRVCCHTYSDPIHLWIAVDTP